MDYHQSHPTRPDRLDTTLGSRPNPQAHSGSIAQARGTAAAGALQDTSYRQTNPPPNAYNHSTSSANSYPSSSSNSNPSRPDDSYSSKNPPASPSPIKRKPVGSAAKKPPSAFPINTTGEVVAYGLDPQEEEYRRANDGNDPGTPFEDITPVTPRRLPRDSDSSSIIPQSPGIVPFHKLSGEEARRAIDNFDPTGYSPAAHIHARNSDSYPSSPVTSRPYPKHQPQLSETMPGRTVAPDSLKILPVNGKEGNGLPTPSKQGKFAAFFGWKGSPSPSPVNDTSPTTTISDRSTTPAQSPNGTSLSSFPPSSKHIPQAIDTGRANASAAGSLMSVPQAPPTPAMSIQIEEMEEEIRDLSEELAGSIRREMELEDQVERLQLHGPDALDRDREKRTSDYFSDSATSSVRGPDGSTPSLEVEKMRRRNEQERAQMKAELSQKLQDERQRRIQLEEHVRILESKVQEAEQNPSVNAGDLERKLKENQQELEAQTLCSKNYESLINEISNDLKKTENERDNLRDEVVPALKAQIEGLETEATEAQKLAYENARMQQELSNYKATMGSIPEDGITSPTAPGLGRSKSMMRRSGSLSRSNSSAAKMSDSKETLVERVKDIEAQRDALHKALKNLLERQSVQNREHTKRVKALEVERDQALADQSPRKKGYEKEVKELRDEIDSLRKRADDALEQKWQCEKGLGSLKMDLDRAEQETAHLRTLLLEHDIVIPEAAAGSDPAAFAATSATLEKAYRDLRAAQAASIAKLQELKGITPSPVDHAETVETLNRLLQSVNIAEAERDYAQKQADTFRAQAESLQESSDVQKGENANLATSLRASAQRVETLSAHVQRQLDQNKDLRERLAVAIGNGERDQKISSTRITELQARLRGLEERLTSAQQQSEDHIAQHEEEVRELKESNNNLLQRLKAPSPKPSTPSGLTPKITSTSSGPGTTMQEALRTEHLEEKVRELESALRDADAEMAEVVQRMTMAQMQVMELQNAKDEAMKCTAQLQRQLKEEQEKVSKMANSLTA